MAAPPVNRPPTPDGTRLRGVLVETAPVLLALVPLGWALGVAIAASPLPTAAGWAGGPLLVSGAAHFALVSAYAGGAGVVAAGATALLIAARGLIYGAALAGRLREEPRWFRALAAYVLVDQMYVLADGWLRRGARGRALRRAYLTAGSALWATWVGAITAGMAAGPLIPAGWHVELVLGALVAGMLAGSLSAPGARVAAVSAGLAAAAGASLPSGVGILAATLAGVLAATLGARTGG